MVTSYNSFEWKAALPTAKQANLRILVSLSPQYFIITDSTETDDEDDDIDLFIITTELSAW